MSEENACPKLIFLLSSLIVLARTSISCCACAWRLAKPRRPARAKTLVPVEPNLAFQERACEIREPDTEYALIPLYDVRAAAGHGAVVEEERIIDLLAFKRRWVRQELNANPDDFYLIYVDGESMEPTLCSKDVILVDRRNAQEVPRDGIYVLRIDGSLLVKRLPGRQVKVTSDNRAYEPFNISLETPGEDLAIIGRVVWTGRRM
ncbi:S24 family peptidase [Candidatus Vondammii sp. HM_W22]|uniref:S24 family peptidase n=1 Tax=Candidatus Vondammii sp. HM_W22 TaxID=2687299 RepID=UPI001F12E93E|nr:S24 family peptidase [Candidatus Vondammii sp. HM_W22]